MFTETRDCLVGNSFAQHSPFQKSSSTEFDSNPVYEKAWEIFKEKVSKDGSVWFITEDLSGINIKEFYKEKMAKPNFYKGLLRTINFPNHPDGSLVEFIMTKNDILVCQIKKEIERITQVSRKNIVIAFKGRSINNEDDFLSKCGWNGFGGETFDLFVKGPLSDAAETPKDGQDDSD